MSAHLKDYVWMGRPGEKPVRVPVDQISRHMVAGYSQVLDESEAIAVDAAATDEAGTKKPEGI